MKDAILYVGNSSGTSAHRAEALRELGHEVRLVPADLPDGRIRRQLYRVGHRLRRPPDLVGTNRRLLEELGRRSYAILWVDKGITLRAATLRRARRLQPGLKLVSYSPDDMFSPDLQTAQYLRALPLYDLNVTTKSYNVAELPTLGARNVVFVDNAYDPATHRPLELTPEERERFSADVGFVGTFEPERAGTMLALARAGVPVVVHGWGWQRLRESAPQLKVRNEMLDGLDYTRAINATRINLGFLRKAYRDLQTTRSIEIPASGGFLLAERTDEHRRLFREGEEAEFFADFDELLEKARHYLAHEEERRRIAAAGRERCLRDGYSNRHRLAPVLEQLAAD